MTPTRKTDKSLIWTIASALVLIGVWAGRIEYQVRRIADLEKQAHETAVIVGMFKMQFFYGGLPKK